MYAQLCQFKILLANRCSIIEALESIAASQRKTVNEIYNIILGNYEPEEGKILVRCFRIYLYRDFRLLIQLFCGEVRGVCDRSQMWHKGSVDVPDSVPVNPIKEMVVFDMIHIQPSLRCSD